MHDLLQISDFIFYYQFHKHELYNNFLYHKEQKKHLKQKRIEQTAAARAARQIIRNISTSSDVFFVFVFFFNQRI